MQRLLEQILKFGIVGFLAFLIDYGILMLLSQVFGVNPVIAAGISFCISLVFNYLASMRYVFSHRENMSSSHEFVLFLMLSVVGLAINEVIIWIGTKTLGTSGLMVTITKVVATTVVMVWNFISRKRWLDGGSK
jgi:putative flippase GtrA